MTFGGASRVIAPSICTGRRDSHSFSVDLRTKKAAMVVQNPAAIFACECALGALKISAKTRSIEMAILRPLEMKLVNDLFGMSSGWVLDFSNRTFEEFFRHEVGIEIYDAAYGFIGTSKGKHLSAFLQVGQPVAVLKALTALWEVSPRRTHLARREGHREW